MRRLIWTDSGVKERGDNRMEQILQTRNVPVTGEYDVVVCGGGPGGWIAAVAAARMGARTALIERYGFVGGMATAGLVVPISVFTYNEKLVCGGIPWEFVQRMVEADGAEVEHPLGNISHDPECYKLIAQRMLLESGAELRFHSYLTGCIKEEGRITHAIVDTKSGPQALKAKYIIDSTGDGDMCAMAGVPMQEQAQPLQPPSLCFCLGGINTDELELIHHEKQGLNYHNLRIQEKLHELEASEEVPMFGGPWFCSIHRPGRVMVNMTRTKADMLDPMQAADAECRLREDVHRFVALLKKHIPDFKDAYLISTAMQTGVRETRHVKGVHVLTGEEYVNGVCFEDAIGRGAHPVDIHAAGDTSQKVIFLKEAAYIPYRSLIVEGFDNLLVAGRCFSADQVASASVRVQASIMGLGQAAGCAAAKCAADGVSVHMVDVSGVRNVLRGWGAVI